MTLASEVLSAISQLFWVFALTAGFLLMASATFASNAIAKPTWVHAPGSWPANESRFFRYSFPTDAPVEGWWLRVAADDAFTVYINDIKVGSGYFWPLGVRFEGLFPMPEGQNTIAVEVVNLADSGGLIAEGAFVLKSGKTIPIQTGEAWKTHSSPGERWFARDFDDSSWQVAQVGFPHPSFGPKQHEKEDQLRLELAQAPVKLPLTQPRPARFVGETFRCHSAVWQDVDELRRVLPILKDMGFNMISIDIPWGMVEKTPGQYDFSAFDVRFQEVVRQGFYLQVKLTVLGGKDGYGFPKWIAADQRLFKRTATGERDGNSTLTYSDPELNQTLARFCKAAAERYKDYPIINYSWMVSVSGEMEYDHTHYQDYSEPAQAQFKQWLRMKYDTVDALNRVWGTTLASFDDAALPQPPTDPVKDGQFDFDPQVVDFFKFREYAIDEYFAIMTKAVREGDPKAKTALTIGHALSHDGARRNAVSAFRWMRSADCFWVDPAPADYYPIRVAEGRAAQLMGKTFAVELDGLYAYVRDKIDDLKAFPEQTAVSFEGGSELVTTANWRFENYGPSREPAEFATHAETHRGMAKYLQPGTVRELKPATDAVYISKWTMFDTHGNAAVWNKIEKYYRDLYGKVDRLVDIVTDDIFTADPKTLSRYQRIHVPCAPVVEQKAYDTLKNSGVQLIAPDPWGTYDEYGKKR